MRILYVSTLSNTINRFMIPHIELLLDLGHHVDIACNIDRNISPCLIERGCEIFNINFQRSPINKLNYFAYKEIRQLVQEKNYDIVHTHTPVASMCVRLACRNIKNVQVIYTAHGFHFYKGAPLKNWLIYYPIERYLAKHTDVLVTINKEDHVKAIKSFGTARITYIPGVGLNTKKFDSIVVNKLDKWKEIGIPADSTVILSVGELNKNKNHETIIKALGKLNNPKVQYVICGHGPLENSLREMSRELGLEDSIKFLGYREDIIEICKVVDVFVFPSYREGLPVALMEAMACGLPVVCSDIRGNCDLIEEGVGGYLVSPSDYNRFANTISKLLDNTVLRKEMGENNRSKIKCFDIDSVLGKLRNLYEMK